MLGPQAIDHIPHFALDAKAADRFGVGHALGARVPDGIRGDRLFHRLDRDFVTLGGFLGGCGQSERESGKRKGADGNASD
jgi:hypothetical protein